MAIERFGLTIHPIISKTIIRYFVLNQELELISDSTYECPYCGLFQQHPTKESITAECSICYNKNNELITFLDQIKKIQDIYDYLSFDHDGWVLLEHDNEFKNLQMLFKNKSKYALENHLVNFLNIMPDIISEYDYYLLKKIC